MPLRESRHPPLCSSHRHVCQTWQGESQDAPESELLSVGSGRGFKRVRSSPRSLLLSPLCYQRWREILHRNGTVDSLGRCNNSECVGAQQTIEMHEGKAGKEGEIDGSAVTVGHFTVLPPEHTEPVDGKPAKIWKN